MKKKSPGPRKPEEITDELIGEADKICACSAVVGEIILATNEKKRKKKSLAKILSSINKRGGSE